MSAMPGLLVAVEDVPQLDFERRHAPMGDQVGAVLMQPAPSQGEQRHAVSNVGALPEGFGFPSSAPSPVSRVIWLVRSKNSAGHASAILIATGMETGGSTAPRVSISRRLTISSGCLVVERPISSLSFSGSLVCPASAWTMAARLLFLATASLTRA